MTMLVASHPGLRTYLDAVLRQLTGSPRHPAAGQGAWHGSCAVLTRSPGDSRVPAALPDWLLEGCLHKLVLVVASVATRETLERWVFNVQREDDAAPGAKGSECAPGLACTPLPSSLSA
jgi:hypothetical protein